MKKIYPKKVFDKVKFSKIDETNVNKNKLRRKPVHPEEEEKIHENLLQVPSEELKREAFNQIVEGIVKDGECGEYSLNENQNVLVIKNGGYNYYLTTGF